ncbi:class I SAM-dependent methyltransferase [Candidatus Woesearchaeota archaeon]|nr:class I SAM-dependent methyltransferase [Candidatus Woesearchaeota archaeon]
MEHYFTKEPKSELKIKKLKSILKNKEIEFYTASGLFSLNKVDNGSKLLINKCIPKGKVLDLGCGYGIIGLTLLLTNKKLELTFSDINERAIVITKKNLKLNNLEANVIQSDGFENIKEKFDTILLNPPQTAGKNLCFKLIEDSKEHLLKNGTLQIVARHKKGGIELSKKMQEVFSNIKEIAKGSGFRIYLSQNA